MLKKRILASSMASVMALGSVSVAAFADETKDYGEAVTEKELQEYIDSFEDFIADELPNYGSLQSTRFQEALDHAQTVLDNDESEAADYAAAYQMVKAVKNSLATYTASQLGKLIEDHRKAYDKNNIRNEDLEDTYYTEDSFQKFHDAFDEAETYVDSDDPTYITDAYVALEDAWKALEELETVTKADMRAAIKAYEQLELEMKNVESWRRGTISVAPTTGTSKNKGNLKKVSLTMEDLKDVVYGSTVTGYLYIDGDAWKGVIAKEISTDDADEGHDNDEGKWIGGYDLTVGTGADALYKAIHDQHIAFDGVKSATVTSKVEIVAAYEAAQDAVAVFNSWKEDTYTTGSKSKCASLEEKYHNQLVEAYSTAGLTKLLQSGYASEEEAKAGTPNISETFDSTKDIEFYLKDFVDTDKHLKLTYDAEKHTLKANAAVYVVVDEADGLIGTTTDSASITGSSADLSKIFYNSDATAKKKAGAKQEVKKIAANNDILKYIRYVAKDQAAAASELGTINSAFKTKIGTNASSVADMDISVGADYEVNNKFTFTFDKDVYGGSADVVLSTLQKTESGSGDDDKATNYNKALQALYAEYTKLAALNAIVGDFGVYKNTTFSGKDADTTKAQAAMDELADGKTIPKVTGSSREWAVVYRKLLYTLEDAFIAPKKTDATLAKLKSKIDEAYELAEKTGDASLFQTPYKNLVTNRQTALEFYKLAKAQTGYDVDDELKLDDGKNHNLDTVYSDLKSAVDKLNKWFNDFQYGYDEMKDKIGEIAIAIDNETVKASDELKGLLSDAAYKLSILEATKINKTDDEDINAAFNDEREFQGANRLKTGNSEAGSKIKPNDFEKDMKAAYEALTQAYEKALTGTAPSGVEGDVDNSGAVNFDDVQLVLTAFLKGETDAAFDVNGDKAVDFDDVNKALDIFLKTQA